VAGQPDAQTIADDLSELAKADSDQITSAALRHYARHWRELFFLKTDDWRTEYEYRVVVLAPSAPSYLLGDYGDSLEAVIVGHRFPAWERPAAVEACRDADARSLRLAWHFGRPGLAELPSTAMRRGDLASMLEALRRRRSPAEPPPAPDDD
jgi:hypothetical protein